MYTEFLLFNLLLSPRQGSSVNKMTDYGLDD